MHLPVADWYRNTTDNNLLYWGLDYPPLTAYMSLVCGYIGNAINPAWMALGDSHGIETPSLKLFMRASVLASDMLVLFPALLSFYLMRRQPQYAELVLALVQPALILIDHGHFQYNNVSLGLALLAFVMLRTRRDVLGSVLFVLALCYKQMCLYYALPVFFYLLGKIAHAPSPLKDLTLVGIMVLVTFAATFAPFLHDIDSLLQGAPPLNDDVRITQVCMQCCTACFPWRVACLRTRSPASGVVCPSL